jgi:hypothetical protein
MLLHCKKKHLQSRETPESSCGVKDRGKLKIRKEKQITNKKKSVQRDNKYKNAKQK